MSRKSRGVFTSLAVCTAGFLLLTGLYLAALRSTLDLTRTDLGRSPETRDIAYLLIHGGVGFLALLLGFLSGRFLSGLGLAYALLFLVFALGMMAAVQAGSFSLACNGHNDLIRHWTC